MILEKSDFKKLESIISKIGIMYYERGKKDRSRAIFKLLNV